MIGNAVAQKFFDSLRRADTNKDHLFANGLNFTDQKIKQIEIGKIMDVVYDDGDQIDGLCCQAARQEIGLVAQFLAACSTRSRLSAETGLGSLDSARDAIARDTPASAATSAIVGWPLLLRGSIMETCTLYIWSKFPELTQ